MSDAIKRLLVLSLVFVAAFVSVHVFRAWRDGQPIFGFGSKESDQQFAPEYATLQYNVSAACPLASNPIISELEGCC